MLREMLSPKELEIFEVLVNELKELNKKVPIIVEGSHDIKVLRDLGIAGTIIKLNNGMSLLRFSEYIADNYGEVILLLDWDSKGKELTSKISALLEEQGIVCHLEFINTLKKIVPHIRTVESLIL